MRRSCSRPENASLPEASTSLNFSNHFRVEDEGGAVDQGWSETLREVEDALRLALAARTERSAIAVLRGLGGVDVPVASAIMTAVDPSRYTILDFPASFPWVSNAVSIQWAST
jgi:hypothetical protein